MKQRFKTAAVLITILVGSFLISKYAFYAVLVAATVLSMYEYNRLIIGDKTVTKSILPCLFTLLLVLGSYFYPQYIFHVYVLGCLVLFSFDMWENKDESIEKKADRCVYAAWGLTYIGLFMSLALRFLFIENGLYIMLPTILTVILCDSAAYFIGIKYGKHKIYPSISPKKSVEGTVAGFITAVIVFACTLFVTKNIVFTNKPLFYLTGGAMIGVIGQLGDLAASLIKRRYNVKDFSNLLPGHGGMLDRIDSQLFALSCMYVWASLIMGIK